MYVYTVIMHHTTDTLDYRYFQKYNALDYRIYTKVELLK